MTQELPPLTPIRVAQLADEIAVAAQTGLHWSKDRYDHERYTRLLGIAAELLAGTLSVSPEIATHWYTDNPGTLTAKVGASVAAFDTVGRLLLIQRTDNAQWALPGGIVEYGETLATAATREAWEESGVRVCVTALLGVYDTRHHGFTSIYHWVLTVFRADVLEGTPGPSNETLAAGFFTEAEANAMPISLGQADPVRDAFAAFNASGTAPFFDP